MARRIQNRRRDESGAVAILCGLLAVLLMGLGAIVVDIGQAYAKRSLLQTDVDLAVMAAAAELDNPGACNPEVVAKATEFLNKAENAVPGQYAVDLGGSSGDQDGYIRCQNWRVDLWAPKSHVDYTLGRIVSPDDGLDVQAHAAAQIKSGRGGATLPFFAVQGCDSGLQSIRNPSGPITVPDVPPLYPTSSTSNNAKFTITPTTVASGLSSQSIEITGTSLKDVDAVTFTGEGGPPNHYEVAVPTVTSNTGPITVPVPSTVLALDGVWYVRVKKGSEYSAQEDAQPFAVGDDKLYCDARYEGNFGTIEVPRNDTNNANWLAWNMIKGLQPALAEHPSPNGQCNGQPGSVLSDPGPVDGTNCLASETGLKPSSTTDGLVSGAGGLPGRLDTDSTSDCSRYGDNSRTAAMLAGKHLNDDLLSCFIVGGASISDLLDPADGSEGWHALSSAIFDSPRFFWLPVLDTDPSMGKKYWPIVGFVPGFITDQDLGATHDAPGSISAFNGLDADSSGIAEVKVVLFSANALPEFVPARGGESDYTGSGAKTLVLVE